MGAESYNQLEIGSLTRTKGRWGGGGGAVGAPSRASIFAS